MNTVVGENDIFLGISKIIAQFFLSMETIAMTLFYLPQLRCTSQQFPTISTQVLLNNLWKPLTKSPVSIFLFSLPCFLSHAGIKTKQTCITSQSKLIFSKLAHW
jgi:hypothetical protein